MIHLIIKDGLGNQMFQYAFARFLQEQFRVNGKEEQLAINPIFLQNTIFEENDPRQMSLQHLKLHPDTSFLSLSEQKKSIRKFKIQTVLATGLVELFRWRILHHKNESYKLYQRRSRKGVYYTYLAYTSYPVILSKKEDKFVFGFFQSEKNFKSISSILKDELKVKDEPSIQNCKMIDRIQSVNSVCLHIRRGDYLNSRWKNLQICNFNYYNDAINMMLDLVENPVFFVFSNTKEDLNWIESNYHFFDKKREQEIKLVYVDLNNPDYEELRLMYSCKHFIISNSTFSWWGAYLSENLNKKVIVPERWNLATIDDSNIYLENWIKIPVL